MKGRGGGSRRAWHGNARVQQGGESIAKRSFGPAMGDRWTFPFPPADPLASTRCPSPSPAARWPRAPCAPDDVNYAIDGPKHRLLMHPFPRRVRAMLGGVTVLDTTRGVLLHESNILPRFYLPLADVQGELLERTDHSTHCPFKGDASYWSISAGGRHAENAVWTYEEPIDDSAVAAGPGQRLPRGDGRLARRGRGDRRPPARSLPPRRRPALLARASRSARATTLIARSERPVVVGETEPADPPLHPARGRARRAAPRATRRPCARTRARRRTGRSTASRTRAGPTSGRWRRWRRRAATSRSTTTKVEIREVA